MVINKYRCVYVYSLDKKLYLNSVSHNIYSTSTVFLVIIKLFLSLSLKNPIKSYVWSFARIFSLFFLNFNKKKNKQIEWTITSNKSQANCVVYVFSLVLFCFCKMYWIVLFGIVYRVRNVCICMSTLFWINTMYVCVCVWPRSRAEDWIWEQNKWNQNEHSRVCVCVQVFVCLCTCNYCFCF